MATEFDTAITNSTEEVNLPTVRLTNTAFIAGFTAVVVLFALSFSYETIAGCRSKDVADGASGIQCNDSHGEVASLSPDRKYGIHSTPIIRAGM